jgi:lysyl-tRNA synthetase class II
LQNGHDANQANALQALITAANSAQGFTQQASNMANTAAGLNSQKMNERTHRVEVLWTSKRSEPLAGGLHHNKAMDKQKFAQQNYDKMKGNLDTQLKNKDITKEEYDKRLKELNDLTLGEVETPTTGTSNNGVSTTGNSGQQLAQAVQGITTALSALQGNPAAQNALIQAITGLTPDLLAEIDAALGNYSTSLVS